MTDVIINIIAENLLDVITAVIAVVVSYYVIPAIKNDLVPWLKDKRIYSTVKTLVQAVEKLSESGVIAKCDKKKEVIRLLETKGIIITEEIEAFIESAVKELDLITSTVRNEIMNDEE